MFKKEKLANGITVVMEEVKGVRSFTAGIWVKVGSRNEHTSKNGVSHFLEHMFFKGTKRRTARDIAFEMDSLGGDINAFTSKENTAFYVKVLDVHAEKGLDLLTDIFCHSLLNQEDIEKERGVIQEEIKMVFDTPDDLIHDLFSNNIWGMEGLGQPVLGDRKTVKALTRQDLLGHIRRFYGTVDTIVSCAGSFAPDKIIAFLNEKLGGLRRGSEPKLNHYPGFSAQVHTYPRELSEVHLCVGLEGIKQSDPARYEFFILNTLLGAGLSSRLFQEIREKRGLVYTIYSYISSYTDAGLWGVYAGTGKKKLEEVVSLVLKFLKELPEDLHESELDKAKEQLKGNLLLGLESTQSRMQNIAKQEIYFGKYFSPAEIIRDIDGVTLKKLKELAERLLRGKSPALTILGPVEPKTFGKVLPPL
jgi:predicted Zn-dependent peptidase